jgi:hypothetical protein
MPRSNEEMNKLINLSQFAKDYKKSHRFSDDFKKQLDREHKPGTKIVDSISGEVYITK